MRDRLLWKLIMSEYSRRRIDDLTYENNRSAFLCRVCLRLQQMISADGSALAVMELPLSFTAAAGAVLGLKADFPHLYGSIEHFAIMIVSIS